MLFFKTADDPLAKPAISAGFGAEFAEAKVRRDGPAQPLRVIRPPAAHLVSWVRELAPKAQ